jgi:ADP-ribosyl-[dinitrogen reductase] hydrolase
MTNFFRQAREDRLAGALLGTAIGDPYGICVPHAALIAKVIARVTDQPAAAKVMASRFGNALLAWSLRHPLAADASTVQACGSMALGFRRTGGRTPSAGAAARSAIVGAYFADDVPLRRDTARAFAEVTHTDPCSVEAAVFVAEIAAACALSPINRDRIALLDRARSAVRTPELVVQLHLAMELADKKATMDLAAREIGLSSLAVEAVPLAAFAFARFGDSARTAFGQFHALSPAEPHASRAIVGAWSGTLLGAACLPWEMLARLPNNDFDSIVLRGLAAELAAKETHGALPRTEDFVEQASLWPKHSAHPSSEREVRLRRWTHAHFWSRRAPSTIRE